MENQKQKKSVGTIALVVLLLIVTVASLIAATYAWAKYTEKVGEGTATAPVAKWNVTATVDGTAQYTKTFTHVVPTKMAPGTSGIIPVNVALNDTDVCVKYEIFIDSVTNKPTNAKFYKATKVVDGQNVSYTKGAEITTVDGSAAAITGYLELTNDNARNTSETGEEYIMWDWPYETAGNVTVPDTSANAEEGATISVTGDEADTIDGKAAATMSVAVRVVATQVDPNSVATSDNP